jgi:acyl-CoA thioesterase-2
MFANELAQLLSYLDLERIEVNLFRGRSPVGRRDRIFGGQVLAQAMVAAGRTVEGRAAHSLHGYFLRPGDPKVPILFEVARIRDGRSFTTRTVVAIQHGEAIFNLSISYQVEEKGFEHQIDLPAGGPPGGETYEEAIRREIERHGMAIDRDDRRFDLPIEIRTEGGLQFDDAAVHPPRLRCWMRAKGRLPDDLALHQCVLAYASDFTIGVSAVRPHPIGLSSSGFRTASLDHAMWFHRAFRADEWLVFDQESPVSAHARGFGRGAFYTREGVLVASCVQESLIRYRPPAGHEPEAAT